MCMCIKQHLRQLTLIHDMLLLLSNEVIKNGCIEPTLFR